MIPQDVLSTTPVVAEFKPPRNVVKEPLEDFALGGVALNDADEGLEVYTWRARYVDGDILIGVPGVIDETTLISVADVTEFQFTFDQNMQPFVTYVVDDDEAFYRWFDAAVAGDFVTTQLPAGSITPRCMLDDSRAIAGTGTSDIILTYMRSDVLYFREQRDRYATENELEDDLSGYELGQVGMNKALRFQWQLVPVEVV